MTNETFRDKVVIITGASSGIGRALALELAAHGACLALAARDAQRLADVAVKCHERGGRALVVPTDVADESQCRITSSSDYGKRLAGRCGGPAPRRER